MSLDIQLRPEAAAELHEAWSWYEERQPGLGDELVRCVEVVLGRASRSPEYYPPVSGEVRRGLTRRFPYGVMYVVRGGSLVVLAIFHGSRDPDPQTWLGHMGR